MKLRNQIAGLALGGAIVFASLAAATTPRIERSISDWAAQERMVPGGRFPGQWDNTRAPYLVGIMDACHPTDPSRRITIMGSAQWGKSETAINIVLSCIDDWPRDILFYAPSKDKWLEFNKSKFQPSVDASPKLTLKIQATTSTKSSTQRYKRFKGGSLRFLSAGTSADLQSVDGGLIICEELTEWNLDTAKKTDETDTSRGDPFTQAETRGTTWGDDLKVVIPSTPGNKGSCKVTELFEEGTQNYWFWKCPECGDHFTLRFEHFVQDQDRTAVAAPCCGSILHHEHKTTLNATGQWVAMFDTETNPAPQGPLDAKGRPRPWVIAADDFATAVSRDIEARDKSFHLWQGISNFSTWDICWRRYEESRGSVTKQKAFTQQVLGLAFEAAVDKPDFEKLYEMRGQAPMPDQPVRRGRIPDWACIVTTSFDTQGDRLEWATYAYGPFGLSARIDGDVIPHGPYSKLAWDEARRVLHFEFKSNHLMPLTADRIGIDTGGHNTQDVYRFVASSPKIQALKGKPNDPHAPALSMGSDVKVHAPGSKKRLIGKLPLWLVGTHELKKLVYHGLSQGLASFEAGERLDGSIFQHDETTKAECKQITAEWLEVNPLKVHPETWKRSSAANEQLDLAVYCKALAINFGIDRLSFEQWQQMFRARAIDPMTADMGPLEKQMHALSTAAEAAPKPKPVKQNPTLSASAKSWTERLGKITDEV